MRATDAELRGLDRMIDQLLRRFRTGELVSPVGGAMRPARRTAECRNAVATTLCCSGSDVIGSVSAERSQRSGMAPVAAVVWCKTHGGSGEDVNSDAVCVVG